MYDVVEMSKGRSGIAHNGISATATSQMISIEGQNAVKLFFVITGTGEWTVKIQERVKGTDTYVDSYDSNGTQMTFTASANCCYSFVTVVNDYKVVATEDSGTATVSVYYKNFSV